MKGIPDGAPEFFKKEFEKTFLASFPGLMKKDWLKLAIAAAALVFGALGFGLNLSDSYTEAAELFAYFGATLVAWLVVSADESAAARKAALSKEAAA